MPPMSITAPSSSAPAGLLTQTVLASQLPGAAFTGSTTTTPGGTMSGWNGPHPLSVSFTPAGSGQVTAHMALDVTGPQGQHVVFNLVTDVSDGPSIGTVALVYAGPHAGEGDGTAGKFSCTNWTASNVAFVQGLQEDVLSGAYASFCHHDSGAVTGDSGTFRLTRAGTLPPPPPPPCPEGQSRNSDGVCVAPPPPPPAKLDWCHVDDNGDGKEEQLNIPQSAIDNAHKNHKRDYAGLCDGRSKGTTTPPGNGGGNH
jgi:hypothetical protein